jgi:type II secretory pathway pseudopilin PulG
VISIIAILVALLLPAVQSAREAARRTTCSNKIKQVDLAVVHYENSHHTYPPGGESKGENQGCPVGARGVDYHARSQGAPWTVFILPYIERLPLYEQFDMKGTFQAYTFDSTNKEMKDEELPNRLPQSVVLPCFQCPSDPNSQTDRPSNCYYACSGGKSGGRCCGTDLPRNVHYQDGVFFLNKRIRPRQIADGLSNTFFLGEQRYQMPEVFWSSGPYCSIPYGIIHNTCSTMEPMNTYDFEPRHGPPHTPFVAQDDYSWDEYNVRLAAPLRSFSSYHSHGAFFAMGDGSVHFVTDDIDFDVYQNLSTRAGRDQGELP